jgi:hypothetical protein
MHTTSGLIHKSYFHSILTSKNAEQPRSTYALNTEVATVEVTTTTPHCERHYIPCGPFGVRLLGHRDYIYRDGLRKCELGSIKTVHGIRRTVVALAVAGGPNRRPTLPRPAGGHVTKHILRTIEAIDKRL